MSLLWGRNADDGVIHAEDVEYDDDRGDTHPSGFVCPSLPCARSLTWYEQFPRFGKMVPRHFQLTRLAPGKTATHSPECEVEDGTWLAPDARGVPPPSPVRRTTLDVSARHRLALRRPPAARPPAEELIDLPVSTIRGRASSGAGDSKSIRTLTSASAVGTRHVEIRRDGRVDEEVVVFGDRDVAWRNFVYEPHRYVDLAERFARFGHITHLLALVVRPREVSEQDGMFRLACAAQWLRPAEDIVVPMFSSNDPALFADLDFERLYVALTMPDVVQYPRGTYLFATIDEPIRFGPSELANEYRSFYRANHTPPF